MPSARRTLVVGPSWVGDMVMAQSLLKTLREHDPAVVIDVLAPGWSLPIIERMPEAHQGFDLPTGHGELGWGKRRRVAERLKTIGYEQAIVLPRTLKSALVPWFAGIPRRTGYLGESRFGLINDRRPFNAERLPQTVQRYVALGLPADAPQPPPVPHPTLTVDRDRQAILIDELGLNRDESFVAFMPGAEYGPAKQWPVAHYAALARALGRRGQRVLIFGSPKDAEVGSAIVSAAGDATVNLCGRTQLADVIDLLALCEFAVTNDSGLMHVAAAVGTPLVAIYGSSTPGFTPPLSDAARILHLGLACSPCFERRCPLGHTQCLTRIGVADVLACLPA
ncbi:MAG: lipopolysaccharide heptosyltransferase II [Salinisphaeraceae bacterium]